MSGILPQGYEREKLEKLKPCSAALPGARGRPFEEAILLRAARAFERTTSFRCAPAFVEASAR